MRPQTYIPFLACLLALSVGSGHAQDAAPAKPLPHTNDGGQAFLSDRERGWHWYEVEPDPKVVPPPATQPPTPSSPPPPEAPAFSVEWLRKHLEAAKIAAINNPTRENVELFGYLQKISMDRAEKFARMFQTVGTLNPALDETIDNPVSTYARATRRDVITEDRKRVLGDLGRTLGIFYFFKSDCPYCAKQSPLLVQLQRTYGFRILPVSLDRKPMLDGSFPEWVPDAGQGSALSISSTPTLYLFRPPHELVLLSVGLQTLPDLENKVLTSAHGHGWLADHDFELAIRGYSQNYMVDSVKDLQSVDWNDPAKALEALRAVSRRAVETSRIGDPGDGADSAFQGTPWTGG